MTFQQAQQFVGRWRRILIPWPSPLTDTDAAQALEYSFLGIAVGPLPIIIMPNDGSLTLSHWPLVISIPALVIMALSYFLSLRFRAAHRLLVQADARHLSDLRRDLYDKPSA